MKGGDDVDIIRQGWDDGSGSFILITDGLQGGGVTTSDAAAASQNCCQGYDDACLSQR